ncbi:MAG: cytochrome c [Bdellovibrionales bacterium]|nr:cytochrome c [Bdellovibrionales bacterium]
MNKKKLHKLFINTVYSLLPALLIASCNAGKNQTNYETSMGMFEQKSLKAQGFNKNNNKHNFITPPKGSVSKEKEKFLYKQAYQAEKNLKNPFKKKYTAEVLLNGKNLYTIYCALCHGKTGLGDGQIAAKMIIKPPSLLSYKIRKSSDGLIYYIIKKGQGLMGSYANQIPKPEDRWAIINYIRTLQKFNNTVK